jgi:hypothetical protein
MGRSSDAQSMLAPRGFTMPSPRLVRECFAAYSLARPRSSPHYSDQTVRYATKAFRPILFTEEEITADPELTVTAVSGIR